MMALIVECFTKLDTMSRPVLVATTNQRTMPRTIKPMSVSVGPEHRAP
jgi:hypothetical protein